MYNDSKNPSRDFIRNIHFVAQKLFVYKMPVCMTVCSWRENV